MRAVFLLPLLSLACGSASDSDGAAGSARPDGSDGTAAAPDTAPPGPYASDPYTKTEARVLLVSVDGFRRDYLDRANTPTLDRLASEGVLLDGLVPAFPTMTFPNHYTLATGLHPAHHGIIDNSFYAPDLHDWFSMTSTSAQRDPRWWGGEPIWITAERQGVTAGTHFWVGSEVRWEHGISQTWRVDYDGSIPFRERVDRVVYWLAQPDNPPRLVTLYFNEPDHTGHEYGPDDVRVIQQIEEVDRTLSYLVQELQRRDLYSGTNLVVLSDHGMSALSPDRRVYVDDAVSTDRFVAHSWGALFTAWPRRFVDEEALLADLQTLEHASCHAKGAFPERWAFNEGDRVPPLVCVAEEGWELTTRAYEADNPGGYLGGTHGFDPADPEMHALFVARGPHFREGVTLPAVDNVHVYSLLARLLQVEPAENDGSLSVWAGALRLQD